MAQPATEPEPLIIPKASQPVSRGTQAKTAASGIVSNVAEKTGYPYIVKADDPRAKPTVPSIQPLVDGFNSRLIDLFALPVDGLNAIYEGLGKEGFLHSDESGVDAIKRKLREYGVPAPDIDTEVERMGRTLFDNLAIAAVTMGTGALVKSTLDVTGQASSAIGRAGQQFVTTAAEHPAAVLLSETGAAIGQHTLGPALEPTLGQPTASMVGATVGGMPPNTVAARALARLTGAVAGGVVGFSGGAVTGNPIVSVIGGSVGAMRGARTGRNAVDRLLSGKLEPTTAFRTMESPAEAVEYARYAVEGDITAADTAITRAVRSVGGISDPTKRAEALHGTVDELYKNAQANAEQLWNLVDKTRPVTKGIPELKHFADVMRTEAGEFNESIPNKYLGIIDEVAIRASDGKPIDIKRNPIDGSVEIISTPGTVFTIKDVRNIQQSIKADLRAGVNNDQLKRNLTMLDEALDAVVQISYPNDGALAQAREYTKWVHDTFTRGALGEFYGKGKPAGQFMTAPQAKALRLLESEKGGNQMADAARALRSQKVEASLHEFVASEFQKRAEELGPEAGVKFLQAPSTVNFLTNFPREASRMERVANDLDIALDARKSINDSYFYRFAAMDPQSAAVAALGGPKKVQNVEAIVARLSEDPTGRALKGFRNALLNHGLNVTKKDPARFQHLLADKDMHAAFAAAFGKDMPRLDRLLEDLARYGGSKTDLATAKVDEAVGGIIGARAGTLLPGGSIQTPGIAASLARWSTRQIFGRRPVDELIELALDDPKWEAYVRSKVPKNLTEMRAAVDSMTALLAMQQGAIAGLGGLKE